MVTNSQAQEFELTGPQASGYDQNWSGGKVLRFASLSWLVPAIMLLSVLVTLAFWRFLPNDFRANEQSDYHEFYKPVAESILAGQGFSTTVENPATKYPPGYPLLLAGLFKLGGLFGLSEELSLSGLAIISMALTSLFVFLLTRDIFGPLAGIISAVLWMTYPFALWLTKQPNSELPFMVVFYSALCLLWFTASRQKAAGLYFLCGLMFGAAMLIRPIAFGICLVLSALLWLGQRQLAAKARVLGIMLLLLGNLVAVLPWETWVYLKTGHVILLSSNGVKSINDGLTLESRGYRQNVSLPPDVIQVMNDIHNAPGQSGIKALASLVLHEARTQPVAVFKLLLLKAARSWYGTDSQRMERLILAIQLVYMLLIAIGVSRLWRRGGSHRRLAIGALLVVGYFWGMTVLALSILRYMVPAIALLFVLLAGSCTRSSSRRLDRAGS